jgi:hypothetical protein
MGRWHTQPVYQAAKETPMNYASSDPASADVRAIQHDGFPVTVAGETEAEMTERDAARRDAEVTASDAKAFDLVDSIMAFEDGTQEAEKTLDLFAYLVSTGKAWSLQGSYGRFAMALITEGLLTEAGEITDLARERLA